MLTCRCVNPHDHRDDVIYGAKVVKLSIIAEFFSRWTAHYPHWFFSVLQAYMQWNDFYWDLAQTFVQIYRYTCRHSMPVGHVIVLLLSALFIDNMQSMQALRFRVHIRRQLHVHLLEAHATEGRGTGRCAWTLCVWVTTSAKHPNCLLCRGTGGRWDLFDLHPTHTQFN